MTKCTTLTRTALASFSLVAVLVATSPASANRPFLTDDARVVGERGLEAIWQSFLAVDDGVHGATETTLSVGVLDRLELALTLGAEDADGWGLTPPVLESKLLFLDPEAGAPVGVGVMGGIGLPVGENASTVVFGYAPLTLVRAILELHVNVGVAAALGGADDGALLPTFGIAAGVAVAEHWMIVAEGLSGAPDDAADFAWTVRGGLGWDMIPEVFRLSAGVAAVRLDDRWTPVMDVGLVWAR